MPLTTDCTTEGRRRLMHKLLRQEGKPQKQAVAIMLSVERRAGCAGASKKPKKGAKKGAKKSAAKRRARPAGRSVGHVSIHEISTWAQHTPLATIDALLPPRTPSLTREQILEKVQAHRTGHRVRLTVEELRVLNRARLNEMTGMARGSFAVRFEHGAGHRGTVFVEAKSKKAAAKKAKKQLEDIEVVKVKRREAPSRAALYPVSAEFRALQPPGHAFGHSPPLAERPHYTAKATRAHRGAIWEILPVRGGGYAVFHRHFGRENFQPMRSEAFATRREAEAWMLEHFPTIKPVVGRPT